jgi:hypothetical protein
MKILFVILLSFAGAVALAAPAPEQPQLVDVDVSGSAGTYNGQTYNEIHLGVNLNFTEWLTWRNAGFRRFSQTAAYDFSGLDSTLRLIYNSPFENGNFKVFAGPGYRWASNSDKNAVLGEAGVGMQLGRFNLGLGAKYLQYQKAQLDSSGAETKREDLSYFITISGGAGISFGSSL